jgi:hypothetical protein
MPSLELVFSSLELRTCSQSPLQQLMLLQLLRHYCSTQPPLQSPLQHADFFLLPCSAPSPRRSVLVANRFSPADRFGRRRRRLCRRGSAFWWSAGRSVGPSDIAPGVGAFEITLMHSIFPLAKQIRYARDNFRKKKLKMNQFRKKKRKGSGKKLFFCFAKSLNESSCKVS